MPEFDAILFDFDGVLADTEPVHWACWAEVLKPLGITLEWDYYRDHGIGIDDKDMLRTLAGLANPPLDWRTLYAEYPGRKSSSAGECLPIRLLTRRSMPFSKTCTAATNWLW